MRKILVVLLISILLVGCASNESEQNEQLITQQKIEINQLQSDINTLQSDRDKSKTEITGIKVESNTAKYILTINISQSHFTLDISQHIKDAMNDITIQIPVDKEFYDSIEVGTVLSNEFRMGSLIMKGSFGNWEVKVENKEVK